MIEALIARQNQRWENVARQPSSLYEAIVETLHIAFPLDVTLWKLGCRFDSHPAHPGPHWPENIRWGLDSATQTVRMIIACNPVGAAAVSRTQLERWSLNRSTSNSIDRRSGETTTEFFDRLWPTTKPAGAPHADPLRTQCSAGQAWEVLSEGLHGRGVLVESARWEIGRLADPGENAGEATALYCQAAEQFALQQAMICAVDASRGSDLISPRAGEALRDLPPRLPSELRLLHLPRQLSWPLSLEVVERFGAQCEQAGEAYFEDVRRAAGSLPYGRKSYSHRALEAFVARRGAAARWARVGFELEREQLGAAFDDSSIMRRELSYTLIIETAGLLSEWLSGPTCDALAVGASALRAALCLWLEDDDRMLVTARTALEQAARLRAWRLKPSTAHKVESRRERTSTRDWLEAAGWRRLAVINRSLGEFSHVPTDPERWSQARAALASVQEPPPETAPWTAEQTTRGSTLDQIALSLGSEVRAIAVDSYPFLGDALKDILPEADLAAAGIEQWLQRCWEYRNSAGHG